MPADVEWSILACSEGSDGRVFDAVRTAASLVGDADVRTETDGADCLDALVETDVGCVVTDHPAPGADDLIGRIREQRPGLAIVAVVGDHGTVNDALAAGATDCVRRERLRENHVVLAARIEAALERAEDAGRIRGTREWYETLLEVIPDTVVILDTEGNHVEIHGFEGWSGYTREELIGEPVSKTMPEEDIERGREAIERLVSDDETNKVTYEMRIETKDGEQIPFENHVTLLPPDEDGRIPGSMSVLRDISERKEREAELELKTRAMDGAPIGITIADAREPGLPVIYANPWFELLTGYDEAAIRGENWSVLEGERSDEAAYDELEAAIERNEPATSVVRAYRAGESPFWCRISTAPVRDEDDEVTHVVGFLQDVTERKEYERAIERRLEAFDDVLVRDLRNHLETALSHVDAARERAELEELDAVDEWLRRSDALLDDVPTDDSAE